VFNFDIQRAIDAATWQAVKDHWLVLSAVALIVVLGVVQGVRVIRLRRRK
jgi:hypothetical protein